MEKLLGMKKLEELEAHAASLPKPNITFYAMDYAGWVISTNRGRVVETAMPILDQFLDKLALEQECDIISRANFQLFCVESNYTYHDNSCKVCKELCDKYRIGFDDFSGNIYIYANGVFWFDIRESIDGVFDQSLVSHEQMKERLDSYIRPKYKDHFDEMWRKL